MSETIVIDASVSLRWVLKEDNESSSVKKLLEDIAFSRVNPLAPTIWLYETLNALKSAVLRKRLKEKEAELKIRDLLELAPELIDIHPFIFQTFEIATHYELSVYDASYIVVAKNYHCPFYTGDEALFDKVKKKLTFVKLLSPYDKE